MRKRIISSADILVHITYFNIRFRTDPVTRSEIKTVLIKEFSIYIRSVSNIYKDLIL